MPLGSAAANESTAAEEGDGGSVTLGLDANGGGVP